jgi:hypothetical protein
MRQVIRPLLTIIVSVYLMSCSDDNEALQEQIFTDVLNRAYLEASKGFRNLSETNEVTVNPFDDHLDSLMILRVKNDSSLNMDPGSMELLNRLEKILNEPIEIDLKEISNRAKFQLIDDKTEMATFDYSKENYAGSSSLSKIAIDDDRKRGVFYVDLQFGKSRGKGGFFVFVERLNDKWEIARLLQVWS